MNLTDLPEEVRAEKPEVVRHLGQHLIDEGVITAEQLDLTLKQQKHLLAQGRSVRLGELLVRNRFCSEEVVREALARRGKDSQDSLGGKPLINPADCARIGVVPKEILNDVLHVITAKPLREIDRLNIIEACSVPIKNIRASIVDRHEIHRLLAAQMAHGSFDAMLERLKVNDPTPVLLKSAIEALLHEAIDRRASDIHIDVKPDPDSWISLRIDSVIRQTHLIKERLMAAIISRLKTISGMDASNSRTAQDGRMQIDHRGRMVGFRVATQPLVDGETMTIRVIDASTLPTASALFPNQPRMLGLLDRISKLEGKMGGLILVTGPTGSGKSTTLYTMSSLFPRDAKNVITVEDPVEYVLPFARQIQIHQLMNQKATDIERSVLRQDPDVLIFGEIRDAESARAALKFAESGHLVLATLHAQSAPQSIERLLSMVPETDRTEAAFVLAATLLAVINQGLARLLCSCNVPVEQSTSPHAVSEAEQLGRYLGSATSVPGLGGLRAAHGCPRCENSGYRGRVALHETMIFNLTEKQRAQASSNISRTGDMNAMLHMEGVHSISRKDVALSLLQGGLIDARTALTVMTTMGAAAQSPAVQSSGAEQTVAVDA